MSDPVTAALFSRLAEKQCKAAQVIANAAKTTTTDTTTTGR
jgi:hypothetical protein